MPAGTKTAALKSCGLRVLGPLCNQPDPGPLSPKKHRILAQFGNSPRTPLARSALRRSSP